MANMDDRQAGPTPIENSDTHTTHNRSTALWILSGTTRVSRYQKKHSPVSLATKSKSIAFLMSFQRNLASIGPMAMLFASCVTGCNRMYTLNN